MKNIIFIIFLSFGSLVFSQELPPSVFMNRITQRLIGAWPMPADYERLQKEIKAKQCNTVSCLDSFFRNYIREKMNKPEFYALFYGEVTEHMGYKSPSSSVLSLIAKSGASASNPSMGRDFALVYRTLKENQSFDDLFTSQIITDPVFNQGEGLTVASAAGTEMMGIDISKMSNGVQTSTYPINLENGTTIDASTYNLNGHANISGLFSSMVFLTRFWTTPLNENRKRAAAFYRLMLCDSMSPALESESEKQKELRLALGKSDEEVIMAEFKKFHPNRHGDKKDCAVCHDRLDPVGWTIRALEQGVAADSLRGAFQMTDNNGEKKSIGAKNFHELTVKAAQTPKYLDCQTKWFIEAFLGKDLELSSSRFLQITDSIEKNKRRIKTVIEDLLMIPEFRGMNKKPIDPPSLIAAKAVLANCTECHSNTFNLKPEQMKARLARASVCLDLANDGKAADMPPADHYWQPSTKELSAIKVWLKEGSPLGDGVNLFSPSEIEKIMSPGQDVKKCRQ